MHISVRERLIAAAGTAGVVALFGYCLLLGLAGDMRAKVAQAMTVLTLQSPPPPPPRIPPPPPPRRKAAQGAGAPRNLRNKASEIVAPRPMVILPVTPPILAATRPDVGAATQTGKADRAGPGEGAGGTGGGNGKGGFGDGAGDDDIPPEQLRGDLSFSDLPPELRASPVFGTVGVRYYVLVNGRAGGCAIEKSSGDSGLDAATCRLIQQHFRFVPSRRPDGTPVRSILEQDISWDRDQRVRRN